MDETTLRELTARLLTELPDLIPNPDERTPVAEAITTALADQADGRLPLLQALASHPATRRWMREHDASAEDVLRTVTSSVDVLGTPNAQLGLYYVCPERDHDEVLLAIPEQPPLCPTHGVRMDLVED
ncbi:hypothetical protein [Gandjariella thermophila]|uniref:Uncharacterized protein n=1 Tax=Gandjariella thermophila TaxID=1931992 RepID=A0A4D4JJ55_9PSEU|nr:hypothetical protein [Gandjariella thermophila]GDY33937.1 hypothetical protein GTS_55700 [Gandjariella thermophila]